MLIRKIVLENIRCFGRVELDLTRPDGSLSGWTVLAGRNGAGKSTLLKAIALSVAGPLVAPTLQRSFIDWIARGSNAGRAKATVVSHESDFTSIAPVDDFLIEHVAAIEWIGLGDETEPKVFPISNDLQCLDERNPAGISYMGPWSDNPSKWFLVAYGPQRRIGFRSDYKKPGRQMESRLASLFDEDITLAESLQWLREIRAENLELLEYVKKDRDLEEELKNARQLYLDVLALLNNGLLPDELTNVSFDLRNGLFVERNGVTITMGSLSDGYRTAIALVLDIVRQMHRCFNGKLEVTSRTIEGKPIVQVDHEGVVLIDEVDAHLHISWQQRIGFWLKQHFPNVQFIVTTHSPFVCQAADPKGLIRLPIPGSSENVEHVSEELYFTIVHGDVDDAVMTSLFGLERPHSNEAEALRSRVAKLEVKLLRGLATPEEKEELRRLSAQLPKTGSALVQQTLRKLGEIK